MSFTEYALAFLEMRLFLSPSPASLSVKECDKEKYGTEKWK